MINKEIVKRYIVNFHQRDFSNIKKRELKIKKIKNKAISIVGPRRVGKTFYLFSLINNPENYLYVDFENPIFYNSTVEDIIIIIDAYKELYPDKKPIVFLDEIQNIKDWERMVRYLIDENIETYVTGSSSKLLSKEIATHLRGRSVTYFLFTLSFREFLEFKDIKYKGKSFYENYEKIKKYIREYLHYGGYPEVVLNEQKERILNGYLELIIKKDILERYRIKNINLVNELIYFSINNYSKYISYDSLYKLFKQRIKVTKKTIINYLSYFEDALLFFFLKRYYPSIKQRIISPRKIYLIDTGYGIFGEKNISRDMENIVFLELLRNKYYVNILQEIYYLQTKDYEIDFLIREGNRITKLINVTYANNFDEIDKREIRGLVRAYDLFKQHKPELIIITWDYEDEKEISWFNKKGRIKFIPLWKWLLKEY
ncbi:MAG: ATP-binding protein [Candidatus Aenigmatarchaeota archaeon]